MAESKIPLYRDYQTIARLDSKTNPIVKNIAPYGTFKPGEASVNAAAYDFAIQGNNLFIRCFDSQGNQIAWLKFTTGSVN